MEVRRVRPDEFEEAGRITALAYLEFASDEEEDPDDEWSWAGYRKRLADVAGRDSIAIVLVAVEQGRILGTLTLELEGRISDHNEPLEPGQAHVRMLGVDPEARGKGVGRALMDAAIGTARDAGKTRMTLNTTQLMKAAQRMYESMGFTRMPDETLPDGFVLLTYELSLSGAPAGTNSPVASNTPSSYSTSTKPPLNCC